MAIRCKIEKKESIRRSRTSGFVCVCFIFVSLHVCSFCRTLFLSLLLLGVLLGSYTVPMKMDKKASLASIQSDSFIVLILMNLLVFRLPVKGWHLLLCDFIFSQLVS